MKRLCMGVAIVCLAAPAAMAQEHFSEGPVWECNSYRTKQEHFDEYMKYLRGNLLPQIQEAKKAGLILDQKVFLHTPENPSDPDVVICTQHASFAKALDYNAADDAKSKEIASKFFKTADEDKQREMSAKRYAFRDFVGTSYYREVNLKPLQ